MPAKYHFNTKFKQKIKFFRLKMMCMWASYKKKSEEKICFLASLKSMKKGVGSGVGSGSISQWYGSGDPDPDPHQNVTDPQHGGKGSRDPGCRNISNRSPYNCEGFARPKKCSEFKAHLPFSSS
jgi:hypothetical protein